MRNLKKLLLVGVTITLSLDAFAGEKLAKLNLEKVKFASLNSISLENTKEEFSIGGGVFYHLYGGGSGLKFFGFNLIGEFGTENYAFRASLNYGFPKTTTYETTGNAFSSITDPSIDYATVNTKLTIITLAADAKYLFGSDRDYSMGGLYGFGGLGLSFANANTTLEGTSSDYDYYATEGKELYTQFLLRLGIGYDYRMDFGVLFAEAILSLPMNKVNGQFVEIEIPTSYGFQTGVRISLNK